MPYGSSSIAATEYYATMAVTQDEANTYNLVGTGSDVLPPPSTAQPPVGGSYNGYTKVGGFVVERASNLIVMNSEIEITRTGTYIVSVGWGTFRHSQNNSAVAFVLGIERDGLVVFSQRPTGHRVANGSQISNVSGGGSLDAQAGDRLSVWVATDVSGSITISNANVTCHGLALE